MLIVSEEETRFDIGCVNWPDGFPYRPEVSLGIRHSGDSLHLHFKVRENGVGACCAADRENIWEDSCVEFFFAPGNDGLYYNIECSCIGKLYMCCGRSREDRVFLPDEAYGLVGRHSSLGDRPFGVLDGTVDWDLRLDIPAAVFSHHEIGSFAGLAAAGNFYKCGSRSVRHYLSWAPINTSRPDFHRPEFFQPIRFEG